VYDVPELGERTRTMPRRIRISEGENRGVAPGHGARARLLVVDGAGAGAVSGAVTAPRVQQRRGGDGGVGAEVEGTLFSPLVLFTAVAGSGGLLRVPLVSDDLGQKIGGGDKTARGP